MLSLVDSGSSLWLARVHFSKVAKLFGRISGDIVLFVSSNRGRLEASNFAVTLIIRRLLIINFYIVWKQKNPVVSLKECI